MDTQASASHSAAAALPAESSCPGSLGSRTWGIRGSEKAEAEAGQTLLPQDEREEAQYPQMVPSLTPAASGHGDGAG